MNIIVTGGAGFIGSTFLNLMAPRFPDMTFINVDKLTYAANMMNLTAVSCRNNYRFCQVDIADMSAVEAMFAKYSPDWVIHFAAESHVDRSIVNPDDFIQSNIIGTYNLLEMCRKYWKNPERHVFHHVSTDEVYGSLGATGTFSETTAYAPNSPYAASKAASDHLVRAYFQTYRLPVKVTNCSNNYGPYQFPEKMIPLMILNALDRKPLPVYGDGLNIRDWLFVEDHCEAIWTVATQGLVGETYNVGGNCERTNIEVVQTICRLIATETGASEEDLLRLITFVPDRPGHDLRYAINAAKITGELGWFPRQNFESGLAKTVRWYLANTAWVTHIRSGAYLQWVAQQYSNIAGGE